MAAFFGQMLHFLFEDSGLFAVVSFERRLRCGRCHHLLGFCLAYDFYLVRLLAAQAYLVSDYLVFDGVFQRGVQHHFHAFALYKAHFNDSLAEAAVSVYLHDDTAFPCLKFRKSHLSSVRKFPAPKIARNAFSSARCPEYLSLYPNKLLPSPQPVPIHGDCCRPSCPLLQVRSLWPPRAKSRVS